MPLMRPLFFEEPANHEIYKVAGTYLFGDDMLVSPVMEPEQKQQKVWFPGKSNWFDLYTGEEFSGGERIFIETREESIPTYVRGGAVIPMADLVQSLDDYSIASLDLIQFHDPENVYYRTFIYHDDGETFNSYGRGEFEKLHITSSNRGRESTLVFRKEIGKNFDSNFQVIHMEIKNVKKSVKRVLLDEKDIPYKVIGNSLEIRDIQLDSTRHKLNILWE